MRGIGVTKYTTNEYCLIDLYILGIIKGRTSVAYIRREVYIVNNLKAKMLIKVNILSSKRMSIDVGE